MKKWVLALAVVGCGGSAAKGPGDGPASSDGAADGASDSGTTDAPPGPITISVLPDYLNDPIASLPVVFSAADGSLLDVEMTDAQGHAQYAGAQATTVTLIKPTGNRGTVTLVGVAPGTALRFGALWMQRPAAATMHASWPSAVTAVTGYYDVETHCGGFGGYFGESSGSLALDARCNGTFDATIAAYYEDRVQSYLTLTNQTVHDGGSLAFTGTWHPAVVFQGSYTNLPNETALFGTLTETYNGERFFDDPADMSIVSTNGMGYLAYTLPPAPGSELHEEVTVDYAAGQEVIGRRLAYTDPVGFDVGTALVPAITGASFDAASNTLSWTTEAGPAPQVVRASLWYPGPDNDYPTWIIVALGSATSVTVPQLPDSLAKYRVAGQVQGSLQLMHVPKSYPELVGDIDLWFGRSNIDFGTVDWQGVPADITAYTNALAHY